MTLKFISLISLILLVQFVFINFLPFLFNTLVLGFSFFFIVLHVVREGLSIVYTKLHAGKGKKGEKLLELFKEA